MNTTIQKWGNSQAIRLPKSILKAAHFEENTEVQIVAEENQIVIKRVRKQYQHRTLKDRFKGYNGTYVKQNIDFGEAVGKEIW